MQMYTLSSVYSNSYDILVKDESSLSQEISAYERRFDLWDNNNDETIVDAPKPSQNRAGWQAPITLPAVNKFEVHSYLTIHFSTNSIGLV